MSDRVDLERHYEGVDVRNYFEYYYLMFMLPHLTKAKVIVETGLGAGDSADIWLKSLDTMPDPEGRTLYTFEKELSVVNALKEKVHKAKWHILLADDRTPEAVKLLPPGTRIDVLYLDAGHDRYEVDAELENFGPMLADTGVLLTHDSYARIPPNSERADVFPDGYTGPTDTYRALKAWADRKGWTTLLLTYPAGMTLCYKY